MEEQTAPNNRGAAQLISYEDHALEAIAATYPAEMREPFLWLGTYIREDCARNLDIAEHKIRDLGLPTTQGTLSKILRGRWRMDASKNSVPPIMALPKFLQMVEMLRAEPELTAMAGKIGFVETPTYRMIENYINIRRDPGSPCKFGMIVGPTGAQKTASCHQFRRKNNRSTYWIEAAEKASLGLFITDVADAQGITKNLSLVRKRQRITENTKSSKVFLLENIQRLYREPDGRDLVSAGQPIFSYLQKLQEETASTMIFTITPEFYREFLAGISKGYFEQFEGRIGGRDEFLILPPYPPREDILEIAKAYELKDAEQHLDYLERVAQLPGRIRILCNALWKGMQEATATGQPFAIEHVKDLIPESRLEAQQKEAA